MTVLSSWSASRTFEPRVRRRNNREASTGCFMGWAYAVAGKHTIGSRNMIRRRSEPRTRASGEVTTEPLTRRLDERDVPTAIAFAGSSAIVGGVLGQSSHFDVLAGNEPSARRQYCQACISGLT